MSEGASSLDKYRATSFGNFVGRNERFARIINDCVPDEGEITVVRPFKNLNRFSDLNYGFSSSTDGQYRNYAFPYGEYRDVMQNRREFAAVMGVDIKNGVYMGPVHGTKAVFVSSNDRGKGMFAREDVIAGTDILITQNPNVLLALNPADCIPGIVYDQKGRLALFHGGREGTFSNIAATTINALRGIGAKPEDMFVGLGPSVAKDCYVQHYLLTTDPDADLKYVGLPSKENEEDEDPSLDINHENDGSGRYRITPKGSKFITLDITTKTIDQLVAAGVSLENIEDSGICTKEEALAGRMASHLVTRLYGKEKYPEARLAAWVQING